MPERGLDGRAFAGPGVDLRGAEADRAIAAAAPIEAWLSAREPGIVMRSLSVDRARSRVLVTLEPGPGSRPRVLRFDPPYADELIASGGDVERVVGEACAIKLAARA